MSSKSEMRLEDNQSALKKTMAILCHHCPFCSHARKHPESLLGKILHHPAHADNCPMWQAEKERYNEQPAK